MTFKVYPHTLKRLIEKLSTIPGLGEKSATRIAFFLLSKPDFCEILGDLIRELPYRVKLCKFCRNLSEEEICSICKDTSRNHELLCVVESPVNLFHIEATNAYDGYYFVLHHLLSPREGIGPRELRLEDLIKLINQRKIKEVILALSPTLQGEATSNYLLQVLKDLPLKITKLACGIPLGMELHFVDPLTLKKALSSRETLK